MTSTSIVVCIITIVVVYIFFGIPLSMELLDITRKIFEPIHRSITNKFKIPSTGFLPIDVIISSTVVQMTCVLSLITWIISTLAVFAPVVITFIVIWLALRI